MYYIRQWTNSYPEIKEEYDIESETYTLEDFLYMDWVENTHQDPNVDNDNGDDEVTIMYNL